jgi:hypothetical protein
MSCSANICSTSKMASVRRVWPCSTRASANAFQTRPGVTLTRLRVPGIRTQGSGQQNGHWQKGHWQNLTGQWPIGQSDSVFQSGPFCILPIPQWASRPLFHTSTPLAAHMVSKKPTWIPDTTKPGGLSTRFWCLPPLHLTGFYTVIHHTIHHKQPEFTETNVCMDDNFSHYHSPPSAESYSGTRTDAFKKGPLLGGLSCNWKAYAFLNLRHDI